MGKILIVDDSDIIREQLANSLAKAGYTCIQASDGILGLKAAKENPPDLILADLNMPNMDGLEMIENIKNEPSLESVLVIMLTAETNTDLRRQGQQLGVRGWINKPVNQETVLKVLDKLVPVAA